MPPELEHTNDEHDIETITCNDCACEVELGDETTDDRGNLIVKTATTIRLLTAIVVATQYRLR